MRFTNPVEYFSNPSSTRPWRSNPSHNVPTCPWRPDATEDEKVAWYVRAKADAERQGLPIGKVAWLYRIMFGEFPSSRVAKRASKIRRGIV
jgi:hypothetical protein